MLSSFTRNATVLGLLVGPFATDMSLPTLPAIAGASQSPALRSVAATLAAVRSRTLLYGVSIMARSLHLISPLAWCNNLRAQSYWAKIAD